MARVHNRPEFKGIRKKLRNNSTKTEMLLWKRLQGSQLDGMKFRRQHSIGRFIVDFYCPDARIAVELDGSVHGSQKQRERDKRKQEYIEGLGIKVLRFFNDDVLSNMQGVLLAISSAKGKPPLNPLLNQGGERGVVNKS